MNDVITEKKVGDYTICTFYDYEPSNPREWDNLGTMICFNKRYNLGDKHSYDQNDYDSWDEMKGEIEKSEDTFLILPLYIYDHSGITISTKPFSCRWDSGQIGFVFVSKKKVLEEYNNLDDETLEKVTNVLEGEVKEYDKYLCGEVYGFVVYKTEKCSLGHEHVNVVETCGGFYDEDECMEEGVNVAKKLDEKVS